MKKVLIANRGEIAVRVIKSCKKLGIKTVAVYSEADRDALHVKFADEAVCIGPPPSKDSYLNGDKIIEVAKDLAVDAIHPGYGFLSENADFAKKVVDNNLVFIGPTPAAITTMGSKLAAKEAVSQYDIPLVPGTENAIDDIGKAKEIANSIGYPILIKASAGGGGKGMRIVENPNDFESQMDRAVSEAKSAFGDGSVFIEKYIQSPRHIEIQVLADSHGNVIHLGERECSIQRRHQKVVEEAPSTFVTKKIREEMGQAAVNVAKSCNYTGAGTVEFLMDENKNFYFLEMNTRLQVEHPITELVTGLDLVELQIKIAQEEVLPLSQDDIQLNGHAIELRVYAEDPYDSFLPSIGKLNTYKIPEGKNIRVDNGIEEGQTVPIYYDPMLAKLITYGDTRAMAISLMKQAISMYNVDGVSTTLSFGLFVMEHAAFLSGDYSTNFVANYFTKDAIDKHEEMERFVATFVARHHHQLEIKKLKLPKTV
ncbi:acetyl-CoA carboxylase biotin carboxylase subunit [Aegicerativicinus sediminis]|uniref:acetyl-CoA carboxylase biotin carboxylase subunit n=1 Tax=Aegicerativicinus sediminis TaxID=2893202 RepID=UPI001E4077FB|nr:acetyl-CoA carboxylase biotin carboxylase subunit [Aegicerativicinus sediminis]